jgi:hypothetical protein
MTKTSSFRALLSRPNIPLLILCFVNNFPSPNDIQQLPRTLNQMGLDSPSPRPAVHHLSREKMVLSTTTYETIVISKLYMNSYYNVTFTGAKRGISCIGIYYPLITNISRIMHTNSYSFHVGRLFSRSTSTANYCHLWVIRREQILRYSTISLMLLKPSTRDCIQV